MRFPSYAPGMELLLVKSGKETDNGLIFSGFSGQQ